MPCERRQVLGPRGRGGAAVATALAIVAAGSARADDDARWYDRPVFRIATEDGATSLRFRLAGQLRWEGWYLDRGPTAGTEWSDSVFVRRLRPVLEGSLGTEDLTWRLHISVAPGQLEMDDLWMSYAIHPQFRLLVGQNKIPFTRYRMSSYADLPVVDWSYETKFFGAERQIGATMHNGMDRPGEFEYELGVYTGVNARASSAIAMPLVFAEPAPNPSSLTDPAAPASFHPEMVARFAWNYGGIDVGRPSDLEGGPPRVSAGLSVAWDARPEDRLDLAVRIAPEVLLKVHGFHALGVFYLGFWNEVTGHDPLGLGLIGGVVQASYVFLDRFEAAARYVNVSILEDLRNDARRYADRRIEAEADPDARAALGERYADVGRVTAMHEAVLGFNVYLVGATLKLQADGGVAWRERTDADRRDAFVRTQIQLAF